MKNARNTHESLSPLTWLLKIFAINSNVEHVCCSQKLLLTKTLLAMGVIGSINILCLNYKVNHMFGIISSSIALTDFVQMVYDHFQFTVDLWFIYKYGQHVSIKYFKQYESIDIILGITDYNTIKWKLAKLIFFFSSIWLTSSAFDFAVWSLGYGWFTPLIYSIAYFYLFIKILTTLDLTSHIMHIETRLTMMTNIAQSYYAASENLTGFIGDSIGNNNWLYTRACSRTQESQCLDNPHKILSKDINYDLLSRCYLLLTDQVEFINCMFGFRILLNSLSLLIDIIRFTNIAVRLSISDPLTTYKAAGYLPVLSSTLRMLTCVAVLVSLASHCEKTYTEKDKILSTIDHLLVNKNPSEKLRAAMVELRALIQARPINFNIAKFFRLDYNYLASIASVTVTYTIILLQSMN